MRTRTLDLRDGTPAIPDPARLREMHHGEALARQQAAREQAVVPTLITTWVRPPVGCDDRGLCVKKAYASVATIFLNVTQHPARICEAMIHEIGHALEEAPFSQFTAAELEARAVAFTERAMKGIRTMTTTTTNGRPRHLILTRSRRELGREGHAIVDRADRERRRLTPAESRRMAVILEQLDELNESEGPLHTRPARRPAQCLCGGTPMSSTRSTARCWGCGRTFFAGV